MRDPEQSRVLSYRQPARVVREPETATRRVTTSARCHLNTRQLTFLVRLDEGASLSKAARAAGLTQSAASKLLRQVETALDVKLFERHFRGVSPTCYGRLLLRHAHRALSELGWAYEAITALKSGLSGKAAVGTVAYPGTSLIPMAVARMKQRHADIVINVDVDSSKQLVQRLLHGALDIVVAGVLDSQTAEEVLYEPLAGDEPQAIIGSARHPLAGRTDLQLEDLIDQPWILPPAGSLLREKITAKWLEQGLALPTNIVETASLPVTTALLQQSNMVAVLAQDCVQHACEAGLLSILVRNLPLGVGAFGLITRRDHRLSQPAQLMLSTLRELAGEVYPVANNGAARLRA